MFSQTAEYALRAVTCLAQALGKPMTTAQIAEVTRVPAGYLSKVLQMLSRAKLVKSNRGLHGGHQLCRPAELITILEVINGVDPIQRIHTCPLGLSEHGVNLCPLHRRLDEAMEGVEKALSETTLDELIREPTASVPMCHGPGLLFDTGAPAQDA